MDTTKKPRTLRLEPAVSEEWASQVLKEDISPNEFAEWLLATADLNTRIAEYRAQSVGQASEQGKVVQASIESKPSGRKPASRRSTLVEDARWSKDQFFDFLEVVSSIEDLEWSLALLNAYVHLGPTPKGDELKALCGFENNLIWHQELRVAKQRLTLQARRMNAPGLFPRAKTAGNQRLHPIEPELFPWLREWAERRNSQQGRVEGKLTDPEQWGPAKEKRGKEVPS